MRLYKGDICAIKLPNKEGYIYFLYFGGNTNLGYVVEIFDYKTQNIEENMEHIINQKSLFENKYIITYAPYHDSLVTKIGKIKIDNSLLKEIKIYDRVSIKANRFNLNKNLNLLKDYKDEEYYDAIIKHALSGNSYIFDDWRVYIYGFKGSKFIFLSEYFSGGLSEHEKRYMLSGVVYLSEDIIDFYQNKIDRLRAEEIIFQ